MFDVVQATLKRLISGGGISLALGLALCGGLCVAADSEPPEAKRVAELIGELGHETYAVRQQATEELAKAGAGVLPALRESLQSGSLEQRTRLIDLVDRIYSAEDETNFDEAELVLQAVADSKSGSLRSRAAGAISAHAEFREKMAVAAIRRLGGRVEYQSPNRIPNVIDPEPEPGKAPEIGYVTLTHDWKGGDEGLWHLRRLPKLRLVYRVKTAKVSDEAIQELSDDLGVQVQARGTAKLGISNDAFGAEVVGVAVGEVTKGGSADKAGIQTRDVITHFDQQQVNNFNELIKLIGEKQPGDKIPITVLRNGEKLELEAELGGW